MKKILRVALALLMVSVCLSVFACVPYSKAATPEQIEASIVKGLEWLAAQQQADGSWSGDLSSTAMAVLKFEERAVDLGLDPLNPAYEYYDQVRNGLNFIFTRAEIVQISSQPAGNPDSDGDGIGVRFNQDNWHYTYGTGIATMAIAACTHPDLAVSVAGSPVDGWTYLEVVDDTVDYMAFGQNDANWP
ncbi:MAG: hypothetical protein QHH18_07380 [Candidatus Bathyarchaeota archaeon]|jgi:hypothetical protein|nr:hypothetical protein [Candidatus Bathyarchaeota archaeon A05DMB-5]MDH7558403.1 hypothetical protein [Candidatus Bathyarchaeota archaeon]